MKLRLVLAAIAIAALLTGCVRLHYTMDVTADDTASATVVMALDDSVATSLGYEDPADAWADFDVFDDLPAGATSEPYSAPGYTGVMVTVPPTPVTQFTDGSGGMALTRDGENFVARGEITAEDLAEFGAEGASAPDIIYTVTFPGAVSEHNGALLDSNTVQWVLSDGQPFTMEAVASAVPADPERVSGAVDARQPTSRSSFLWIGVSLLGVAIIGAGAVIVVSKKRRSS